MSNDYRQPEGGEASGAAAPGDAMARDMVNGPAIALMATAGVGIFFQLLGLALNLLGAGLGTALGQGNEQKLQAMFSGVGGIIGAILGIAVGVFIFFGASKMKNLENYGLAMATAVVAMVPCFSPCCVLGLPIGIWALVVLNKPEIKSAFR